MYRTNYFEKYATKEDYENRDENSFDYKFECYILGLMIYCYLTGLKFVLDESKFVNQRTQIFYNKIITNLYVGKHESFEIINFMNSLIKIMRTDYRQYLINPEQAMKERELLLKQNFLNFASDFQTNTVKNLDSSKNYINEKDFAVLSDASQDVDYTSIANALYEHFEIKNGMIEAVETLKAHVEETNSIYWNGEKINPDDYIEK